MNIFIVIGILVSFPMTIGLDCYQCSVSTGGCNDPFDKKASGVTITGAQSNNTYCRKIVVNGGVIRSGEALCVSTNFVLNLGTTCCQTDLCNGARTDNQIFIMLIIGLIITFAQIQWV